MTGPLMLTPLFTQGMNFAGSMLVPLSLLEVAIGVVPAPTGNARPNARRYGKLRRDAKPPVTIPWNKIR